MWMFVLIYCGRSWAKMGNVSTKGAFDDESFLSSMTDPKAKAQRNKRLGKNHCSPSLWGRVASV